ncbi:MAG: DivIVA domain-containing protein [Oscillospiraceae bacterium]|nr:DivIVA domain-containing protein [Oscillospiraceae bacterium]
MMTAKDIRELRFEKAAWGYRPEDIDEFLGKLEACFQEIDNEREDANHKIQLLADKVREYMKDEDAIKDAWVGAQKEGHRILDDANEKAEQILNKAKEEAARIIDETTEAHNALLEKNRQEIAQEQANLVHARQMVADFKRSLFDMYKSHLEMISAMPETEDPPFPAMPEEAPPAPAPEEPQPFSLNKEPQPFSLDKEPDPYTIRFGDLDSTAE